MVQDRFILRNEHFGATLYDRKKLIHKFLLKKDLNNPIEIKGEPVKKFERWYNPLEGSPRDIIYSPLRIYFEMTLKCNLRCKTCFNSSGKEGPNEMNSDEILKSLEDLRKDNVFDIRFTGGEVTQKENWFEILRHAKSLGFAVSLNTNGVYDSKEDLEKLVDLDLNQITISLDGAEKAHSYIRGKGTFEEVIESLDYLHSHNANTRINTVLTKASLPDYKEILDIAGKYCQEINFFYMRTVGRSLDILDQVVTPQDLNDLDLKIEKEKNKYPHLNILHGSQVMQQNSILNKIADLQMGGPDGFTRMNLQSDGSIYAGGYVPYLDLDLNLGNIRDYNYSILDIWRNSKKLTDFRSASVKLQRSCSSCEDRISNICPGASMEMELLKKSNKENLNPYCSRPENLK